MKKRFSEEQIIQILREAERGERTIGENCRGNGVAEQSFYRYRQKFSGMEVCNLQVRVFFICPAPKLITEPKNLPYPEHLQPYCPEGFLPPPPVTWRSPITDIWNLPSHGCPCQITKRYHKFFRKFDKFLSWQDIQSKSCA